MFYYALQLKVETKDKKYGNIKIVWRIIKKNLLE